jgi:hypothetical protein
MVRRDMYMVFWGETCREDHFEEVVIYGKILEWILNKMMKWRELDSSGSA